MAMAWNGKVIGEIDKDKQVENIIGLFHIHSNEPICCSEVEWRE